DQGSRSGAGSPRGYHSLTKPGSAQLEVPTRISPTRRSRYRGRVAHPVEAWKLEGISPRAYQHPADRAASAALSQVPYLDQVVRKLVALGYERALRAASL